MTSELKDIKSVKPNRKNPRVIKDAKFKKLVQSIKEFPEMLKLRPIVVNSEGTILGGNMRYRASVEAGLKEIWVITADLTKEQEDEFIVKDNSSFGEWDWDILSNHYELTDLGDWGIDIPSYLNDEDKEPEYDNEIMSKALDAYINKKVKGITIYFDNDQYEKLIKEFESIMDKHGLESNTEVVLHLLENYEEKL